MHWFVCVDDRLLPHRKAVHRYLSTEQLSKQPKRVGFTDGIVIRVSVKGDTTLQHGRVTLRVPPPPGPVPAKDVVRALGDPICAEVDLLGLLAGQAQRLM